MAREDFRLRAIIEAQDSTGSDVASAESGFRNLSGALKVLGAVASGVVFTKLIKGLRSVVEESVKTQQSIGELETAALKYGTAADAIVSKADAQSQALASLAGTSDELIRSQQAVLLQME